MEGRWKAVEGRWKAIGGRWKAVEGRGRPWKVADKLVYLAVEHDERRGTHDAEGTLAEDGVVFLRAGDRVGDQVAQRDDDHALVARLHVRDVHRHAQQQLRGEVVPALGARAEALGAGAEKHLRDAGEGR